MSQNGALESKWSVWGLGVSSSNCRIWWAKGGGSGRVWEFRMFFGGLRCLPPGVSGTCPQGCPVPAPRGVWYLPPGVSGTCLQGCLVPASRGGISVRFAGFLSIRYLPPGVSGTCPQGCPVPAPMGVRYLPSGVSGTCLRGYVVPASRVVWRSGWVPHECDPVLSCVVNATFEVIFYGIFEVIQCLCSILHRKLAQHEWQLTVQDTT